MAQSSRTTHNALRNEIATHGNGPFEARVVSALDPSYMGSLLVDILRRSDSGSLPEKIGNSIEAKYLSPFYGTTGFQHNQPNDGYSATQKSYGMWAVPPDPGTRVLVIFVNGDISRCYWIGCIQDNYMNFMVPDGRPSTEITTDATPQNLRGNRLPVGEYNKLIDTGNRRDPTKFRKPYNIDFTQILEVQGLIQDEARGLTTSSARRDLPSSVFGISTPGPLDKRDGAPKGLVGPEGAKANRFVNRLGGSSFVMDDGDDKFLRETPADLGPPKYVNKENGEEGGDPTLPHNELTRIRTRSGHQILMHNTEDLIYIANARGTAWVELSSDGKIDIYANDSISVHSDNDLNFTADRDVNIEGGRNVNIRASARFSEYDDAEGASGNVQIESKYNTFIRADQDMRLHVERNRDDYVKTNYKTVVKEGNFEHNVVAGYNRQYSETEYFVQTNGSYGAEAITGRMDLLASGDSLFIESTGDSVHIQGANDVRLRALGADLHLQAGGKIAGDGSPNVFWNSGQSVSAQAAANPVPPGGVEQVDLLQNHNLPKTSPGVLTPADVVSIVRRMPSHEPYLHHENLDPQKFKKDKTDQQVEDPFVRITQLRTDDTFQKSTAGGTREGDAPGFGPAANTSGTRPVTQTPDFTGVTAGGDLLSIIAQAESGANYNTVFSNSRITPEEYLGKSLVDMTVSEVLQWADHSTDTLGSASSAAGKYQIIRGTLRGLVGRGVIAADELFNAAGQDKCANALLEGRGLSRYISGGLSEASFAIAIAQEWASMPVCSRTQGRRRIVNPEESYYAGDGLNKSLVEPEVVIAAIRALRPQQSNEPDAPPTRSAGPQ